MLAAAELAQLPGLAVRERVHDRIKPWESLLHRGQQGRQLVGLNLAGRVRRRGQLVHARAEPGEQAPHPEQLGRDHAPLARTGFPVRSRPFRTVDEIRLRTQLRRPATGWTQSGHLITYLALPGADGTRDGLR